MSITYGGMIPKIMDSFYSNISKPKKLTTFFYIDPIIGGPEARGLY